MTFKREILRGQIFFENFIPPPPPPLESQLDALSTQFLTSLVSQRRQQIDTPPTHPRQNKRHSGLRMKMRPNQGVRSDAKKYARVYPEPWNLGHTFMSFRYSNHFLKALNELLQKKNNSALLLSSKYLSCFVP